MRRWINLVWVLTVFLPAHNTCAQVNDPVTWGIEVKKGSGQQRTLRMKAVVAPGWHLYSQHLKEGGPVPTRFRFRVTDAFTLAGSVREEGDAVKFYDDTYEMDITWYGGVVLFEQDVEVLAPTTIQGVVQYMVCNQTMCIPAERNFSIAVNE